MFRFEVHVRITDESGQHIQHMSTASNPSDSFLFSSLFDGDGGVIVGSSGQLSNFCSEVGDPFGAETLLSSLRAEELCCGLVDDLVSRTSGREDGLFVGQSGWKMGFPGDWNIFASSSDDSSCGGGRHWSSERASSWEGSPQWSSEEDQNPVEFDSEESRALWESLSTSSDPYNPLFFSACFTTSTNTGKEELSEPDLGPAGLSDEERPANVWVSRSDSEVSWSGSDSSGLNVDEESEKLLELFGSTDPYNPLCFTASTSTSAKPQPRPPVESTQQNAEGSENFPPSSDHHDEEERLWNSLRQHDDPYHPLNFQAPLHTRPSTMTALPLTLSADSAHNKGGKPRSRKPRLPVRRPKKHSHPDQRLVPWKKPGPPENKTGSAHKKVSPHNQLSPNTTPGTNQNHSCDTQTHKHTHTVFQWSSSL